MSIHCDNKFAFDISHNLVQHGRTRNSKVNPHFIKEKFNMKDKGSTPLLSQII